MSRTPLRRLMLAGALAVGAIGLGGCYAYPVGYAGYDTYGYDDYAYAAPGGYYGGYPRAYAHPRGYTGYNSYPRYGYAPRYYNAPRAYAYPRYGNAYPRYGYRGGYGYYGDERGSRR